MRVAKLVLPLAIANLKGYLASVIALISGLVERAGMGLSATKGSITGIYTVLADGDDTNDPVVDTARAILDGHVVLNREYANMGIYPAIDISQLSAIMVDVVTRDHSIAADRLKKLINVYNENKDLILMGVTRRGKIRIWMKLTRSGLKLLNSSNKIRPRSNDLIMPHRRLPHC